MCTQVKQLISFWQTYGVNKEYQLDKYINAKSPSYILRFIQLLGNARGAACEKFASQHSFTCLEKRVKSEHDHTIHMSNGKVIKVEKRQVATGGRITTSSGNMLN